MNSWVYLYACLLLGGARSPLTIIDHIGKGCEVSVHTEAVPQVIPQEPKPAATTTGILTVTKSKDGKEVFSTAQTLLNQPQTSACLSTALPAESTAPFHTEEEDDLSIAVAPGIECRHKGCRVIFVSDAENRIGNGEGTVCTYHPAPVRFGFLATLTNSLAPIDRFIHSAAHLPRGKQGFSCDVQGYLCCKRRVLEFEEFLKIEGCKKGRHVFVPKQSASEESFAECRVDHYQTPSEVHVSVFAKQADKERSKVTVEETQVHFDLYLPAQKRFKRTIQLFGPVEPTGSSYKFFGTKVEVILKKLDTRSWTVLEKTTRDLGNLSLTFGVGGRTGTIGGKEIILDEQNRNRA
ncbi:HSP20-like chaperone [Boletus reticuloceps]|uniref:HSP20-like chaperone n=1 Tax=Boletus reticuloceps TaxID=495285 RepID=A0A8I3AE48_9AGAM|nr:HSP20-like chaperone [Boletus reticuloceps]